MHPLQVGAVGLILWGIYQLVKGQKSPLSTQATVAPAASKPPTSTSYTSSSPTIAAIQTQLNALGANPRLTVDGISGPQTIAAIKAFQSAHGITPDGVVGPITQAALDAASQGTTTYAQTPTASQSVTSYQQIPLITPSFTPLSSDSSSDSNNSPNFTENVNTWADEPAQSFRKA